MVSFSFVLIISSNKGLLEMTENEKAPQKMDYFSKLKSKKQGFFSKVIPMFTTYYLPIFSNFLLIFIKKMMGYEWQAVEKSVLFIRNFLLVLQFNAKGEKHA